MHLHFSADCRHLTFSPAHKISVRYHRTFDYQAVLNTPFHAVYSHFCFRHSLQDKRAISHKSPTAFSLLILFFS